MIHNHQYQGKLRNAPSTLSQRSPIPHNHFSKSSPCGPIPHNQLARALMPRQPYSEAVKSDGEERFPLLPRGEKTEMRGGAFFNGKKLCQ